MFITKWRDISQKQPNNPTNKKQTNKQTNKTKQNKKQKQKQKKNLTNKQTNKQKTRERSLILIINGYCTQQSWSLIMPGMESARYLQ